MARYEHVFEADYSDLKGESFFMKGKWGKEFFKNDNPIVLELGCGKGEYSVGLAELFPNKNFIGIDIKGARMHTGATEALEKKLLNVAFVRTRIEFINAFFEQGEVDEIWLTFPDPQMKKVTKRLTSTYFLQRYLKFIKSKGLIHLKTDSNFLYTYTNEMVKENAFKVNVNETDLYNSDFQDEILTIQTYYERKWLGQGLAIKYLQFELVDVGDWKEPEIEIEYDDYHSVGRGVKIKESILTQPQAKKKGK